MNVTRWIKWRRYEILYILLGTFVILLVAGLFYYLITYRRVETVMVKDRWWTYELAVKYDTTSVTLDADGQPSVDTDTHTRCRTSVSGRVYPPTPPAVPCQMRGGDYLRHYVSLVIKYRVVESDKDSKAEFDGYFWDVLEPGSLVMIESGVRGIVDAERVEKGAIGQ